MKTAVIDVGGGMRGVYASGVFDCCMDNDIHFDVCIGVSAGSANIASYLAGQRGRNYVFYTQYALRKEYMSLQNFIFKKNYVDLDYVYGTLSNSDGEDPLDYPALRGSRMEYCVVAADAETGEVRYFGKEDIGQDNYDVLKASSSIPFVCRPYPVQGRLYFDGALGGPVPVEKAFSLGCDYVVVLLTKPEGVPRNSSRDERLAAGIQHRYPAAAHALRQRASRYNAGVYQAQRYAIEGRALIVAPDDTCGVDTLTRDKAALRRLYEKGLSDGAKIEAFLAKIR